MKSRYLWRFFRSRNWLFAWCKEPFLYLFEESRSILNLNLYLQKCTWTVGRRACTKICLTDLLQVVTAFHFRDSVIGKIGKYCAVTSCVFLSSKCTAYSGGAYKKHTSSTMETRSLLLVWIYRICLRQSWIQIPSVCCWLEVLDLIS